jgi:hypothetical protein
VRFFCQLFGHRRSKRLIGRHGRAWVSECIFCDREMIRYATGEWSEYVEPDCVGVAQTADDDDQEDEADTDLSGRFVFAIVVFVLLAAAAAYYFSPVQVCKRERAKTAQAVDRADGTPQCIKF